MRDRFRAGDPSALGEAYDEHARVLHHYAYRVCGDRTAAEDVVSAVFLEAWRCRGKVHAEGGSLRPWLLGIATNIMRGARADLTFLDAPSHVHLAYRPGVPLVTEVWRAGTRVV